MKFFLGLVFIIVGGMITWKTEGIMSFFGRIDWAEQNMHLLGGTRMFYKLLGLLVIIIGMLMVTGLGGGAAEGVLSLFVGK